MRGFTILEISLVIAMMFVIAALTFPITASFMRSQTQGDAADELVSVLRRAQSEATYQKNDSSFGVKVLSNSYVLFEGSSYATRNEDEDEVTVFSSTISHGGQGEVVFEQLTGIPSATGTISVILGREQVDIAIHTEGRIER